MPSVVVGQNCPCAILTWLDSDTFFINSYQSYNKVLVQVVNRKQWSLSAIVVEEGIEIEKHCTEVLLSCKHAR